MNIQLREELKDAKRIVVKVGSNVITKRNGKCDLRTLRIIVEDICELEDNGYEVILVSSGSVAIGKAFLKKHLPRKGNIDLEQSASSIGQPKLINKYSTLFEENNRICSQILLTHDDFRSRQRFLNAKQTIDVLIKNKIIPILNENDSISYNEITVGDNDHLAAQTAQMVNADALLLVTSAKGLYDKDPAHPDAKFINFVEFGTDLSHIDTKAKTAVGRGGMESKIEAINKVTQLGIKAIISSKDNNRIVLDPLTTKIGTLFGPKTAYDPELRKAWIVSTKKSNCYMDVDEGAYRALLEGKSLFPSGIINVEGDFFKGDCVEIRYNDEVFAYGVSEYNMAEVDQIKRKHSDDIEGVLGHKASSEVVQTINLVLSEV